MSSVEQAAKLLWERDEAYAKVERLQRELDEAKRLLTYADAAIRNEYRLRIAEGMRNANAADEVKP